MMHVHSLGRAARYYPERPATLGSEVKHWTFRELHDRVAAVAAGLSRHGFRAGDRLAVLLPNELEYLELIYACSWLGVIAVPVNARSSAAEIDRVLADASPRGLIRHSSLPVPTVHLSWELVLDKEPLDAPAASCPDPIYDPDAILALIYTSGTTGHPKGVVVTHANIQANIDHLNYWMPYREGGVHLHAAPVFHIARLSVHLCGAGLRHLPDHDPEVQRSELLRDGCPGTRQPHRTRADDDQPVDPVPGSQGLRSDQPRGLGLRRITDIPCIGPSNERGPASMSSSSRVTG